MDRHVWIGTASTCADRERPECHSHHAEPLFVQALPPLKLEWLRLRQSEKRRFLLGRHRQDVIDAARPVDGIALDIVDPDFTQCLQGRFGFHVFGHG